MKYDFLKDRRFKKITASVFLLAVFLCFSLLGRSGDIAVSGETEPEQDVTDSQETEEAPSIFVDISGCVAHPGVYELPAGSRLFEALEMAGGMTAEGDPRSVNRAKLLTDEEVIVVMTVEQYEAAAASSPEGGKGSLIDLNSADSETLQQLSGVGPATAQRILDYRRDNGPFRCIEDLMNVSGIGSKTFARWKDHICVK